LCVLTGALPSEESSPYIHSEAQKLFGPCRYQEGEFLHVTHADSMSSHLPY